MGLWSSIKSGIKELGETILDVGRKACEWTSEALHTIKEKTADAIEYVSEKVDYWGHKLAYALRSKKKSDHYEPEPCEVQIKQEGKRILEEHCPNGIQGTLETQSAEQRLETFENIATDVARSFGLKDVPEVKFFAPSSLSENSLCGYYSRKDNSLNLNVDMIISDSMNLVEEQVYTIFHEMIHARQWAAVKEFADGATTSSFGYSTDRILEYANNFCNYISPEENREAYEKQPLERDAFGFERSLRY